MVELNTYDHTVYKGVKLVKEGTILGRAYPGSGEPEDHGKEYDLFTEALSYIKSDNPVMIELGCHWSLWSLVFRYKFQNGRNIISDVLGNFLQVGKTNFLLNGFDYTSYHCSCSMTDANKQKLSAKFSDFSVVDLNLIDICAKENIDILDLLHADIQESDILLMQDIKPMCDNKRISNIILATHSHDRHRQAVKLFTQYGFKIIHNIGFGKIGGDGYIFGTLNG